MSRLGRLGRLGRWRTLAARGRSERHHDYRVEWNDGQMMVEMVMRVGQGLKCFCFDITATGNRNEKYVALRVTNTGLT